MKTQFYRGDGPIQNQARRLLEVINNFGLFIQLPDVHHPLAQLSPTSIDGLVPRLASGVQGLLLEQSNIPENTD